MKYFSLFTGIGGFELGIQQAYENTQKLRTTNTGQSTRAPAGDQEGRSKQLSELGMEGLSCVGYSEIDKYATQIYQSHFPEHKNYGDITQINEKEIPDFDLLVGGFPCQSFSIAGKRRGFNDTRGTLFFDIARILQAKRPRLFLLENVKGLLSHDNGNTFKTIITTLDELGYDLQWQVLNSKDFGVPQNRERVYIVGHIRGTPRPQVFPFTNCNENHIAEVTESVPQAQRVYGSGGISPTLDIGAGGNRQPKVIAKTVRAGGRSSPHGSKQNWDSYEIEGAIRRLTPKECERLQGFPDDWTNGVSDTQRYKTLGNAVTTNVVQAIMERIMASE